MLMIPDPAFERILRQYDDELRIRWNARADRWVIGRMISLAEREGKIDGATLMNVRRRFHPIFHVTTDQGGFRQPGQDTIERLAMMDLLAGDGNMDANKRRLIEDLKAADAARQKAAEDERDDLVTQAIVPTIIRSNTPTMVM